MISEESHPRYFHGADNRLAAFVDVDVLDGHLLRAFSSMAVDRLQQRRVGARELVGLRQILASAFERLLSDQYNTIGAPKSDSSVRTIPLAPEALAALRLWKLECRPTAGDFVFPTSTGNIEHHSNMLRGLAPVMKEAGITDGEGEPKYGLHDFRHFFASWCINPKSRGGRALPPKEVQTLMGHSSIVMTLDIYGHLFPRGDDANELAASSRALFV